MNAPPPPRPPKRWTAILLAGRRPGTDPLAVAEGVEHKVMLDVAGQPMVRRVTDTLLATPEIGRVVVLTQDVTVVPTALPHDPRITVEPSAPGIARSINALAGSVTAPWPVFVTTADHPLLTSRTISTFLSDGEGSDVAVGVVEQAVVRRRFPDNKRTWLKFGDGWWTGANLFAFSAPAAAYALEAWSSVEGDRKKGWRLVARFGPVLLARALTRTIGIGQAAAKAGARLGVRVKVVPIDDPLAAVDVDKPSDLALARAVLAGTA